MAENDNMPIDYSNTIKKSNELSMAKLNQGLTLNQMQLLAYAIFSTQQDGKTSFRKYEFQNKFQLDKLSTAQAYKDSESLAVLQFSLEDLDRDIFEFHSIFKSIVYREGVFTFIWNDEMIPHILDLKERYILTDLSVASNFRSSYSWILYEYIKAQYGYWYQEFTRENLLKLFDVEGIKSYQKSIGPFKERVLKPAIREINEYTELDLWYTEHKVGIKITGFTLQWRSKKRRAIATSKQKRLLNQIISNVKENVLSYLSVSDENNLALARKRIEQLNEIDEQINDNLTSEQAKQLISDTKWIRTELENIRKTDNDKENRDTSVYYNWLEDNDEP